MTDYPLMTNNISKEDIECLIDFLRNTDRFTNGPKVREFEKAWSEWLGVKNSLFVHSGSAANFITMAAISEIYGDGEIIVPAITWESDIASVIRAGLKPVLADVNMRNMAMDLKEIKKHVSDKTKAVFLSHILGYNALSDELVSFAAEKNILLIEDVCESHGATFTDKSGVKKKCGSAGFASNFSFYYAHHMSTVEGGMICTNDDEFYQYCRMFRSHGMVREADSAEFRKRWEDEYPEVRKEFMFTVPGYNMRSTELNAVIGLNQLKRLDGNIKARQKNYEIFINSIDGSRYHTDFENEGNSNYAFVILLRDNDAALFKRICDALDAENVEYRRGTAGGGNQARQPFVRKYVSGINASDYPVAEHIHEFGLYIGNYPGLDERKIIKVCELLNSI